MVCEGTAFGTVPSAYCRKGDTLKSACVPETGCSWGPRRTCLVGHKYQVAAPPVTAAVVVAAAADLAGPIVCWVEGTGILLLLLRVSAEGTSYQAAVGPAVAEWSTFQGYLEIVPVAAASFPAVLLLFCLLDLGCLLVLHLDFRGHCVDSDEGSG